MATHEEESRGIDGYIEDHPVSIKPDTYRAKRGLNETIDLQMIYYSKKKDGIVIEFD